MQSNPSDPCTAPRDPELSEQALVTDTDLQRCIQSLQYIVCDLLIENEKLRRYLAMAKFRADP
jgi:hypothetical protein